MIAVPGFLAIRLSSSGHLFPVVMTGTDIYAAIKQALDAKRIEAEYLSGRVWLWRDLEATISDRRPQLNICAMLVVDVLRGPIDPGPWIYGDILLTGPPTYAGLASSISESGQIQIRKTIENLHIS